MVAQTGAKHTVCRIDRVLRYIIHKASICVILKLIITVDRAAVSTEACCSRRIQEFRCRAKHKLVDALPFQA